MLRKLVFVGMILVLMASFTAVLADQDALDRYCNSDQYGCWVTNEEGGQDYIMFWSESARELFMGPGSNAVVADPVPAGRMSLGKAPISKKGVTREEMAAYVTDYYWSLYADDIKAGMGFETKEEYYDYVNSYSRLDEWYEDTKAADITSNTTEENTNTSTETNTNTSTEENTNNTTTELVPTEEKPYCDDYRCMSEEELQEDFDGLRAYMEENGMEVDSCGWDEENHRAYCTSKPTTEN